MYNYGSESRSPTSVEAMEWGLVLWNGMGLVMGASTMECNGVSNGG